MATKRPTSKTAPSPAAASFAIPSYGYHPIVLKQPEQQTMTAPKKTTAATASKRTEPLPEPVADAERHRVIITGRGQAKGRAPTLVRLRPDVVSEIKSVVDGPLYLTIEIALRRYAKELRAQKGNGVEMIRAEDLG